jgi:hypothetical protein
MTRVSCTIPTVYDSTEETTHFDMLPYLRSSFLDKLTNDLTADVHGYISSSKWRTMKPDAKKSGTTWIELLADFDLHEHRSPESILRKDVQAHQRFLHRERTAGGDGGGTTQVPIAHEAGSKPSLAFELVTFKAAFRRVVKGYVPTELQSMFEHSSAQSDKRLRQLGIGNHSPAISGVLDLSGVPQKQKMIEQVLQRKRLHKQKLHKQQQLKLQQTLQQQLM